MFTDVTIAEPGIVLSSIPGELRVVVVEPHAGPQLPFVRGRDGGLRVYADVTAPKSRVRRGPGTARGVDRREVFVPPGQRRQHAGLELEPMMWRQGVIELEPGRVEIAVLAEDVVGRVGGEYERRIVG